jgi:hypothetical protein
MATLILGAVGSVLGGPIGGAIGALAGSLIDQTIIIPALFPQASIDGPKLDEFRIQTQDEGSPANIAYGTQFRAAGTIRWTSDIIEVTKTDRVGGKGGGGAKIKTKTYYVHLAMTICRNQISEFRKIFADGKLLYDSQPDITIISNQLTVTVTGTGTKTRMIITSPSGGPDLSTLKAGANVAISGFANGANNGTFQCVASQKNTSTGVSTATFKNTGAVAEAAGAVATLFQVLPKFDPKKVEALTFYYGDETQGPDPLIESIEGTGFVPGFRGSAYFVAQRLLLEPYGNRIPFMNTIGVSTLGTTIANTIGNLVERSGRSSGEYDVTGLSGENKGFTVSGPQSAVTALQPMLLAHDVLEQEGNGVLRFFFRRNATVIDIPTTALAAHEGGNDIPRPFDVSDIPDAELPADVTAKFLDSDKDDNVGAQKARKNDITTDGTITVDLPLVMNAGKGVAIARRLLWTAWANRQTCRLQLPPSFWYVQENDCLRLQAFDFPWLLLVQKVDIGHNWVIAVEATLEIRSVLTQSEEFDPPDVTPATGNIVPPPSDGVWFEIPPLTPSSGSPSAPTIGFGAALEHPGGNWGGSILWWSPDDDDDDYVPVGVITDEGVLGFTLTTLSSGPTHVWDLISTFDVYLVNGELENRTADDVLNGANRAIVGKEIIGFTTATLIADRTWRLSGLLRGMRGTEDQVGVHAVNDQFMWLNTGLVEAPFNPAWIGTTRYLKFVSAGAEEDDVSGAASAITGASLVPLSCTDPMSFRNSNDDITVSWKRRSRAIHDGFAASQPPIFEEYERYEVDFIYPVASGTVIRTYTVNPSDTAVTRSQTYQKNQQEVDGVPIGAVQLEVAVYQISAAMGRGKVLSFLTV